MICEEIISSIDEIRLAQDNAELAVLESLVHCYEKQNMLIEESVEDTDMFAIFDDMSTNIIQESGDVKKNNKKDSILSKIWHAIKQFLNMIVNRIKKIITNFTNKSESSLKGLPTESVSSIAERVLKKGGKKNKPDNIDSWSVPKINPKYVVKSGGKVTQESVVEDYYIQESSSDDTTIPTKKITIPTDPKSEIKGEIVELKSNAISVSMGEDKKTLKITYHGFGKGSHTKVKGDLSGEYADIPGQDKEWYSSPKVALHLMTHDDDRKSITELVELALRVMKKRKDDDIKTLNKEIKMGRIVKIFLVPELHTYEVTLSQIQGVQSWASDLLVKMDAFTSTDVSVRKFDDQTIKSLNMIVRVLMRIQISLNYISSALNNVHIIDASFYQSIKNLSLLDEFVGQCIKAGLPPKYVAYNAWLISDNCIRGDGKYKPLFGHARATIFPPNKKIVLKIALSGLGVVSNETEVRFTNIFKDMDRIDLIAPVLKDFKNNALVAMERVEGDFDLSPATCKEFAKNADKALTEYQQKTGKKLNIKMGSQHVGNVAFDYKYKVYRSIDYGVHYRNS